MSGRKSGIANLLLVLALLAMFAGALLFMDWLIWRTQKVVIDVTTICTDTVQKNAEKDYYEITASLFGEELIMDHTERADEDIFHPGQCDIKSWKDEILIGKWVTLVDANGRRWVLSTSPKSTYDPRGKWKPWHNLFQ